MRNFNDEDPLGLITGLCIALMVFLIGLFFIIWAWKSEVRHREENRPHLARGEWQMRAGTYKANF